METINPINLILKTSNIIISKPSATLNPLDYFEPKEYDYSGKKSCGKIMWNTVVSSCDLERHEDGTWWGSPGEDHDSFENSILAQDQSFSDVPEMSFASYFVNVEEIHEREVMLELNIPIKSEFFSSGEMVSIIIALTSKQPKGESGVLSTKHSNVIGYMKCRGYRASRCGLRDIESVRVDLDWNNDSCVWKCYCSSRYSEFKFGDIFLKRF
jgi:hypothetical protein